MSKRTVKANGQSVICYGDWDQDNSNCECVFDDEAFDGIYTSGGANWQEVANMLTKYAADRNTTVIELTAC